MAAFPKKSVMTDLVGVRTALLANEKQQRTKPGVV
jgi:hypothetical protein